MTAVKIAFWGAVLLSCRALHGTADHRSIDKPYKRLATRSNVTTSIESIHPSATLSSTLPSTRSEQGISSSGVSVDAASDATSTTAVEGAGFAIPTDGDRAGSSASEVPSSVASVFGDTFIASITTVARPPLTTPPALAAQTNSTILAFPAFSLNTTSATTATGPYANSSAATPAPSTAVSPTTTEDFCTTRPYGPFTTVIEYSIIRTWTITWFGDPSDYTPPFPTISTPKPCTTTTSATGRFTVSVCDSSGQSCSLVHTTGDPDAAIPPSTTEPWWVWVTDTSAIRGMEPTLTFLTTDKNPAVIFPTSLPPDYGGQPDSMGNVHSAPYPNQVQSSDVPGYGNKATTDQNVKSAPITTAPLVTVTVKPSIVVIDDQTFTDNPAQPTSTVVVDRNTFTINPTEVVGVGATVTRPPKSEEAASPPPTKTTIGDIGVDIEGSSVIIDKTSFTIGPRPTTVVIKGQTITLGPGAIVFPSQTLAIPAAQDTTQVVFGAELITAIGSDRVVIESRTITYGPGSSTITSVIDGDTILIGPSGIIVHGETYGGSSAVSSTDLQFAAVGGVTISQIGPTMIVVQGITYTLEPLAPGEMKTTTVLGGETITIGPEGVAIETWTLDPPYMSTTTITPSNGAAVALPTATAVNTNKKSNDASLSSRQPPWMLTACIATIVGIMEAKVLG